MWQRVFETLAQEADKEYAMIDAPIVARARQTMAAAEKLGLGRSEGHE